MVIKQIWKTKEVDNINEHDLQTNCTSWAAGLLCGFQAECFEWLNCNHAWWNQMIVHTT
jgi:hypothetical protein